MREKKSKSYRLMTSKDQIGDKGEKWKIIPYSEHKYIRAACMWYHLIPKEWGVICHVSNIIFPDENAGVRCQYSNELDKI